MRKTHVERELLLEFSVLKTEIFIEILLFFINVSFMDLTWKYFLYTKDNFLDLFFSFLTYFLLLSQSESIKKYAYKCLTYRRTTWPLTIVVNYNSSNPCQYVWRAMFIRIRWRHYGRTIKVLLPSRGYLRTNVTCNFPPVSLGTFSPGIKA